MAVQADGKMAATKKFATIRCLSKFIRSEIKLVRTQLGAYYMSIPVEVPLSAPPDHNFICALDPGCRTFQTVYGTDNKVTHIGTSFEPIMKDLRRADHLASLREKLNTSLKRKRHKHRFLRCFERVRIDCSDCHGSNSPSFSRL